MILYTEQDPIPEDKLVGTIGFFDGVHAGHRFLINELNELVKEKDAKSVVITFRQHPRTVLHTDYQPRLLNSPEEKLELLATTGVDCCILLDFTPELSQLSAEQFIAERLTGRYGLQTLLTGYDHRFGHDHSMDEEEYRKIGEKYGLEIIRATPYLLGEQPVSSSRIRKLLDNGRVEEAARLLTYPYHLQGTIKHGYKIGRTIGFPTANIQVDNPDKIIPGLGVYAVKVYIYENEYNGMLHIGNRPTLGNGDDISLEVNILDFEGDIYNNQIGLSFIYHIRDNIKFDSLEELRSQLIRDREKTQRLLTEKEAYHGTVL